MIAPIVQSDMGYNSDENYFIKIKAIAIAVLGRSFFIMAKYLLAVISAPLDVIQDQILIDPLSRLYVGTT
jgi:hypothetical protein